MQLSLLAWGGILTLRAEFSAPEQLLPVSLGQAFSYQNLVLKYKLAQGPEFPPFNDERFKNELGSSLCGLWRSDQKDLLALLVSLHAESDLKCYDAAGVKFPARVGPSRGSGRLAVGRLSYTGVPWVCVWPPS